MVGYPRCGDSSCIPPSISKMSSQCCLNSGGSGHGFEIRGCSCVSFRHGLVWIYFHCGCSLSQATVVVGIEVFVCGYVVYWLASTLHTRFSLSLNMDVKKLATLVKNQYNCSSE